MPSSARDRPVETREPQRGPAKHYRGALSPPLHSVCLEIETPKASRGRKRGERCPLTIRLGVRESVVRSPSGVQGRAPGKNGFYACFRLERSHLEHDFQHFLSDGGAPQTLQGPGKLPPLSTGLPVRKFLRGAVMCNMKRNRDAFRAHMKQSGMFVQVAQVAAGNWFQIDK